MRRDVEQDRAGLLELALDVRVERVAQHLEREDEHVAHRVDDDGLARGRALDLLEEVLPALGHGREQALAPQDPGRPVVLGHLVLVGRVPPQALEGLVDERRVGDPRHVELGQEALLDHARDVFGGRAGDVVAGRAALELGDQLLVVAEHVVDEVVDAELGLERVDVVRVDVVAPVVDEQLLLDVGRRGRRGSGEAPGRRPAARRAARGAPLDEQAASAALPP